MKKLITCLFTILFLLSQTALAFESIDVDKKVSFSAVFCPDGSAASNVSFKLWRAADVSPDCQYTVSDKFARYPLTFEGLDSDLWRALAQTMAAYAAEDNIAPDFTAKTNSEGSAVFSDLETGLYLVSGSSYSKGSYTYTPAPFLICLPDYDGESSWLYDVTAQVKYDSKHNGGGTTTLTRKVLKAWKNDDKASRPESVSVTLLKDGKAYDTVTLTAENNGRYTWDGLDRSAQWQLIENDVPKNYTVTVSKEGITFLVTNTYRSPDNPPDDPPTDPHDNPTDPPDDPHNDPTNPPDDPHNDPTNPPDDPYDDPTGTPSDDPTETPSDDTADATGDKHNKPNVPRDDPSDTPPFDEPTASETVPEEPKLPQTGMLWWPVPLLAVGGMIVFMIGWVKQRTDGDRDEE